MVINYRCDNQMDVQTRAMHQRIIKVPNDIEPFTVLARAKQLFQFHKMLPEGWVFPVPSEAMFVEWFYFWFQKGYREDYNKHHNLREVGTLDQIATHMDQLYKADVRAGTIIPATDEVVLAREKQSINDKQLQLATNDEELEAAASGKPPPKSKRRAARRFTSRDDDKEDQARRASLEQARRQGRPRHGRSNWQDRAAENGQPTFSRHRKFHPSGSRRGPSGSNGHSGRDNRSNGDRIPEYPHRGSERREGGHREGDRESGRRNEGGRRKESGRQGNRHYDREAYNRDQKQGQSYLADEDDYDSRDRSESRSVSRSSRDSRSRYPQCYAAFEVRGDIDEARRRERKARSRNRDND